jgi:hypothetical protein
MSESQCSSWWGMKHPANGDPPRNLCVVTNSKAADKFSILIARGEGYARQAITEIVMAVFDGGWEEPRELHGADGRNGYSVETVEQRRIERSLSLSGKINDHRSCAALRHQPRWQRRRFERKSSSSQRDGRSRPEKLTG